MELTVSRLRSLLFGAAEVSEEKGGLRGYKCTAPIRENWGNLAKFLKDYASHSTGIRLDFHTDAQSVSFTLSGGKFEGLIDGFSTLSVTVGEEPQEVSLSLPEGEHRVTLLFPFHGAGVIYGGRLMGATSLRPHVYRERIHFLGDSITQGFCAEADSYTYAWKVAEHFDADCLIHGVGGGYFHPSVFEKAPFDPDRVIVALGTNDFSWGNSMEDMREYTAAYLDRVKEVYGAEKVTCVLPIWRSEESKPVHLRVFFDQTVAMIREEEEKRGFSVVDGLTLVPHRPEFFIQDQLHPNGLGFCAYAAGLIRALEQSFF